jgi:hypothetical protein
VWARPYSLNISSIEYFDVGIARTKTIVFGRQGRLGIEIVQVQVTRLVRVDLYAVLYEETTSRRACFVVETNEKVLVDVLVASGARRGVLVEEHGVAFLLNVYKIV